MAVCELIFREDFGDKKAPVPSNHVAVSVARRSDVRVRKIVHGQVWGRIVVVIAGKCVGLKLACFSIEQTPRREGVVVVEEKSSKPVVRQKTLFKFCLAYRCQVVEPTQEVYSRHHPPLRTSKASLKKAIELQHGAQIENCSGAVSKKGLWELLTVDRQQIQHVIQSDEPVGVAIRIVRERVLPTVALG